MKIFKFHLNKSSKNQIKNSASFSHLSKVQQKEVLKKGAEHFSKYFSKSFEKLAKE
jgi:hypothetical protein